MKPLNTQVLQADQSGITQAAQVLQTGGLVAFATETVYGLGADACNDHVVARIFQAKGRPQFNPLIVHVASVEIARQYVEWGAEAQRLAQAFWPGPLTLVLPMRKDSGLSPLVSAGLPNLAIRIPAHPQAQALLSAFGGPVAAPSANPSGQISPTQSIHVRNGLGGRIEAILEGGPCQVGVESTILGLLPNHPITMLRHGGLAQEDIEAVLGRAISQRGEQDPLSAPGQLLTHYAPNAAVRLNATEIAEHELWLGFGPEDAISGKARKPDLNLSPTGDLTEAAANLFGYLHQLDSMSGTCIAVSPIPRTGLGRAINDRLQRAAAPRDVVL